MHQAYKSSVHLNNFLISYLLLKYFLRFSGSFVWQKSFADAVPQAIFADFIARNSTIFLTFFFADIRFSPFL